MAHLTCEEHDRRVNVYDDGGLVLHQNDGKRCETQDVSIRGKSYTLDEFAARVRVFSKLAGGTKIRDPRS